MVSIKLSGLVAVAVSSIAVQAQGQYWIDPESIDISTKTTWCSDQTATCPQLCLQDEGSMDTNLNDCDPEQLTYECECGNGNAPNMTQYSLTLPYHICQRWQEVCVRGCYQGNNICQSECRELHPCGASDPTRVNVTSTSTIASKTASRTATGTAALKEDEEKDEAPKDFSNFAGKGESDDAATDEAGESKEEATPTPAATGAASAIELGRVYGLPAVAAGLFAVFSLVM